MQKYTFRLCQIDRGVVDSEERLCADDLEALEHAIRSWNDYVIEIRQEGTFIARVKPGDIPPTERDPSCLLYPADLSPSHPHAHPGPGLPGTTRAGFGATDASSEPFASEKNANPR